MLGKALPTSLTRVIVQGCHVSQSESVRKGQGIGTYFWRRKGTMAMEVKHA
jgi:hypothetical protein